MVVTVGDEIATHAVRISAELVAGVATHPDHRENGYRTRVLEFCLADLAADGVPIAELEGYRPGYARFGFEDAGR